MKGRPLYRVGWARVFPPPARLAPGPCCALDAWCAVLEETQRQLECVGSPRIGEGLTRRAAAPGVPQALNADQADIQLSGRFPVVDRANPAAAARHEPTVAGRWNGRAWQQLQPQAGRGQRVIRHHGAIAITMYQQQGRQCTTAKGEAQGRRIRRMTTMHGLRRLHGI
jgi:hypothetical protein